ncbi:MAG: MFS transporter [Acholeplasmataceae bacterium]
MRLDYRKIFFIGLIFFGISLFWQTYDMIVARALIDKFGLNQTWSGFIMALDNIMAVFLLPIIGALSDRTNSRLGRRTPYVIVGTVIAAFAFMALSFADHRQSLAIQGTDIVADHYGVAFAEEADLSDPDHWDTVIDIMEAEREASYRNGSISSDEYDRWHDEILIRMEGIADSDEPLSMRDQSIIRDVYYNYLSARAWEVTASDPVTFVVFMAILFVALVGMALYRSPAVALMPDITIKPLRSKANAIISLMGAVGGILAVNIIMFSDLDKHAYQRQTAIYITVGIIMVVLLAIFLWKVREPKLVQERQDQEQELGLVDDQEPADRRAISREKRISLYFLLASVFLWYAGYNAVMTKITDYLPKVLNMDFYEPPFIIFQAVVIISILPIGLLSMKVGRKNMVIIGILMAFIGMATVVFLQDDMIWIVAAIIGFAGIGWAMINVNSYPMVVELSQGSNVGVYTGYYYSAAMLSQIFTPIFSGMLMDRFGRLILFPYGAFFVLLSLFTMLFVRHGDAKRSFKIRLRRRNG